MQLLIATENQGKKKEFASILGDHGIECVVPSDISSKMLKYPEESGSTFSENAYIKADFLFNTFHLSTVADDSGLSVLSLDGFPGLKSARWLEGSDQDRCQGVLDKLNDKSDRSAFFTCVLCYIDQISKEVYYFEGVLEGSVSHKPSGIDGFGYDSIFIPKDQTQTLADLGAVYKNQHSHRAKALRKLTKFLKKTMID
jgi:XTP/dITP diphosphohydrolase